jgi:rsbT antagonist protein RsbS
VERTSPVPVLQQGDVLIAAFQGDPSDAELLAFERDLVERAGSSRARGVILDVSALPVLDSFATRTLREIAHAVRLRGARVVVVGIQPGVAFAMVRLGLTLEDVETALDLDHGLDVLRVEGTLAE